MPIAFSFKRNPIFIFLILLSTIQLQAQHIVKGTVISEEDRETLIGVTDLIKNTTIGTSTDVDGNFSLELTDPNSTLSFSYLGYTTQEIEVNGQNNLEIILRNSANQLEEVVVTQFGIKRQKRALGYSTESVKGIDIAKSNAPNVVNALAGKAAGVNILSPNGVDGGTTRIEIRGNNNITGNNQPLIVVDGIPLDNEPGWQDVGRGTDWGSAINNINAQDIATMDILKGPTASALYGSRGANGVVLITTKRGKVQKGIGVNYSFNYKTVQPYRFRDVQNKYGAGGPNTFTEPTFILDDNGTPIYPDGKHVNVGPANRPTTEEFGFYSTAVSWGPEMKGQLIKWWDGEMRPFDAQPDNLKLFFDNGSTATHNLSFSGGGKFGTMRASLTRQQHEAVIPNSEFTQSTVNLGANLVISPKLKADISASYINYNRLNAPSLGDDNNSSFGKGILYSWPRSYKGLEKDINILPDGSRNDYNGLYPFTFSPPNLWWNTYNQNINLNRNKLLGGITLSYDATPWLNILGRTGIDFTLNQFEERHRPINNFGIEEGYYGNSLSRNQVLNSEFIVSFHKEKIFHSKFDIKYSFGGAQFSRRQYGISARSGDWIDPWLYTFNNYVIPTPNQIPREVRNDKDINSLFSFINLSYDNYVFLELTGRKDWTSSLPIDNNSYFYPSASVSVILSEALDLNVPWLSFLKVRGAVAKTATDTDPFNLDFVYETGNFGGSQTATLPDTIPPIALQPQFADSYEVGASFGLFKDRISLDVTYYNIRSYSQILNSPLPNSSGAGFIKINTGKLENKGFEFVLDARIVNRPNFYVTTGFNFSNNKNFVVNLGEGAKFLQIANIWGLNGPAIVVRGGEEYGTIIGYDFIYHEDSGKPILNEDGTHFKITDTRVPIGNASPKFTGGWSTGIGFKGFTLNTLVDFNWGGDVYAGSYVIGLQTGQSPETLIERDGGGLPYTDPDGITRNVGVVLDGVYEDGQVNDKVVHYYYKYLPNAGGWGKYPSKPGILKNNWVKLREVSLSYQFPKKLIDKTKVFQDLNISLVGRDLFYIYASLPDRVNPEGSNGAGNARGLEWAAFPGMRSFGFAINASF